MVRRHWMRLWKCIRKTDKKRTLEKKLEVGNEVYLSIKYLNSIQPSKKLGSKCVDPFPIVRIINTVTVELKLPKNLRKVHPIFHCSLLKLVKTFYWWPFAEVPSPPGLIEGDHHFEVKNILDTCFNRGKRQYLISWKHFPSSEAEWVAAQHVWAPKLLLNFRDQYPDKLHSIIIFSFHFQT